MANNALHNTELNILYQNVRGLRTKCLDLFNNILLHDYDILLFSETWLQDDVSSAELCDARYDVFRCDRNLNATNKRTGGGVMICVRRELRACVCADWVHRSDTEALCLSIPADALDSLANLHLVIVYLPPDSDTLPTRLNYVSDNIQNLVNTYPTDNIMLIGDFNLPFISWYDENNMYCVNYSPSQPLSEAATRFLDNMSYHGLSQSNLIHNINNKYLDLVFCNLPISVSHDRAPLLKEDTHHPSLNISVMDLHVVPFKENNQKRFNFFKCNYLEINEYLDSVDWSILQDTDTLDNAVNLFYKKLEECFSRFVPLTSKNIKSKRYPAWYKKSLLKINHEKMKAHKKWKRHGNPRDYDEFTLLRKRQKTVQKRCFLEFAESAENLTRYSPKYFWSYVKAKRRTSHYPKQFSLSSTQYSDPEDVCSAFNKFFESVFNTPSILSNAGSFPIFSPVNENVLSSIDINEDIVTKLLQSLDKNKGAGCDNIPPYFLASCAKSLSLPLTILFRKSLNDCTFPSVWKQAQIVPIHKKGSKSAIENYRPISILCTISKIFEKVIFDKIYPFISPLIPPNQHGFMRRRSTTSNLSLFSNYILCQMENGGQVDVIYTDFEKAFDRVDHDILLRKLQHLGIHGDLLRWVRSYLSNRSQAVVLGGFRSNYITIPSGIPQGSHLGPLLYNIYIHDIGHAIQNSKHLLYADDKKIYLTVRSLADCKRLQNDLNNLYEYYVLNKITVSTEKCQCISFTRKTRPIMFTYNFNNVVISRCEMVRDLGVYLDRKMLFSYHIDIIVTNAYRNLGFIIRTCRPFKSELSLKIVYYAYVRSILEYASSIWSPCYDKYILRLEKIQKKFLKYINFKCKKFCYNTSYKELCRGYNILTLEERRQQTDMALLYDIICNGFDCPELVEQIFIRTPRRRTTHTTLFHVPFHSTNYGKNSVFTRIVHTYNQLFPDIDPFNGSKHIFMSKIRQHIRGPIN